LLNKKEKKIKKMQQNPIVLFDGVCNLCNGFVQFAIKHDKRAKLKFASIQSDAAQNLLAKHDRANQPLKTVILIEGDKLYEKSSAGLRILRHFGGAWQLFYILMIFPKFIRDIVYNFIANNRYKWFGKKNECWIPTPELKSRFL